MTEKLYLYNSVRGPLEKNDGFCLLALSETFLCTGV